ncbi:MULTISPECIES: NADP-dependent oxidoreductase [Actinosynnema]|uniref:NADP-dependent oxidoreductase n=1 Tax=Actinosynnema TaxID=40566 RepID=UPI0020A3F59B|nr:NADP-dependent oxidoreductase [Actinosynnema pretiosum]MCP2096797.1 NADPH:quinone reductase [Actinosynnema pretiosum]
MTGTMKAVRLHEHGGPEVLRLDEVPVPEVGPGEVRVRVRAVGLNPPDWYLREGMTKIPPELRPRLDLPLIPGTDVSGVVEEVGEGAGWAVGDEVFGMLRFPSPGGSAYAEQVVAPATDLARKPVGVDHAQAAGAPMAGLTAWQFLIALGHEVAPPFQPEPHRPVPLGPGTTVLVNGAAGGVGHFAVQLARWRGARVVAVASGSHGEFLRELGADVVVDYTRERAEDVVDEVDLVLDAVGGEATGRFLPLVRRGGALFPVFPGPYDVAEAARREVTVSATQVRASGAQLAELGALLGSGEVRVGVDSVFPLADAAAAHARAERGHIRGKIVLSVD